MAKSIGEDLKRGLKIDSDGDWQKSPRQMKEIEVFKFASNERNLNERRDSKGRYVYLFSIVDRGRG